MTTKKSLLLALLLVIAIFSTLQAQTPVTAISTTTQSATPSSYTVNSTTYNWGAGNDLILNGVEALGHTYNIDNALQRDIEFIRVDNAIVSGVRCRVFGERTNNTTLNPTYATDDIGDCSMEAALVEPVVNRGALDIFHNVNNGSQRANNIERIDILFHALIAPAELDEIGFLATEKSGNNEFKAAAITSLDANGKPASYTNLVLVNGNSSGNSYGKFGSFSYRFLENAEVAPRVEPEGYRNSNEPVGYSLITFSDLGISEGDQIYGISFFGKDVIDGTHDLLDPTTFPQNTDEGADVYGGLGSYFTTANVSVADQIDTDNDGIADFEDMDDDNDGIPDAIECMEGTLPSGAYTAGEVTFSTTDLGNGNAAYLDSLEIGGVSYTNFKWPDSYSTNFTTTGTGQMYERENNSPTSLDKHSAGSWNIDILPAFRSNNLKKYQSWDANAVAGSSYYEVCYDTPINTFEVPLLMIQERNGNNSYQVEVYSPEGDLLNPGAMKVMIPTTDYINTGTATDLSQPLMLVIKPITDFAPFGSLISCIRVFSGSTGDAGDGKVYTLFPSSSNEICADSDKDGIPNYQDLDSDNDGIPDLIEAGGVDVNGDGFIDYPTPGDPESMVDIDGDGLADTYDDEDNGGTTPGWVDGTIIPYADADNDGFPDAIDLDADNDGIPDLIEAGGVDMNGDGLIDGLNPDGTITTDADGDGFADQFDPDDDSTPGIDSGEASDPLVETNGTGALLNGETGASLDTDGDGLANHIDLDSDNDGIPDLVEAGGIDINGDGRTDNVTDADNDGYADIYDADDDGTPGVEDATDPLVMTGGSDTDADGKAETSDNITFTNGNANNADTDGDGRPDFIDLDADNDGIPDLVESGGIDPDSDGMIDTGAIPWDADGDGLADIYDENASDGPGSNGVDGTALIETGADTNGDGIINNGESMTAGGSNNIHVDGDPYPNHLDLDADNDGITDVVENASGNPNADNGSGGNMDGKVDNYTDTGNDGWNDASNSSETDTDSDGIPDYLDIDADNDGIADYIESVCSTCPTAAGPGMSTTDTDGNGVLDIYENMSADNTDNVSGANVGANPNLDDDDLTDNLPDYLDLDTDEDNAYDWAEGFDVDGDGAAIDDLINMAAAYEAANGNPGHYPTTDTDLDGVPDWLDNQPGVSGYTESGVPPFLDDSNPAWIDNNDNGLADIFDPARNGTMAPTPDSDSLNDADWRDNTTAVFLPVELTEFKGFADACLVRLTWTSESEEAFDHYELQRSSDGVKFNKIEKINAAGGNFSQSYQYDDQEAGGVNYYRLKMIDLDGSYTYSKVLLIATDCVDENENSILIFPNPLGVGTHTLNMKLHTQDTEVQINITDQLGANLRTLFLPVDQGWNSIRIDVSTFPPGTYFISQIGSNSRLTSKSFIIAGE